MKFEKQYTKFDSVEKHEAIEELLAKEIDFEYYMATGVVEDHYPLHKSDTISQIQSSFSHYKRRLLFGFLNGSFEKYFEPLDLIKNYFGEKYAFEYAFLMHYQSWLTIPAFFGVIMVMLSA